MWGGWKGCVRVGLSVRGVVDGSEAVQAESNCKYIHSVWDRLICDCKYLYIVQLLNIFQHIIIPLCVCKLKISNNVMYVCGFLQ